MHVKSLKVFCDVVGRRSFSRAADENGISQSGASQIVSQLEEELGVKLIDRSKRPFVLTREGELYYDGCKRLVPRLSALAEEVRSLRQEVDGRVQVASIYSVGLSHMDFIVREFLRTNPKANVGLQYQHPRRVYELVENSQVDLGLVSYPKQSRTIQATSWRDEPMGLVCSPQHPLADRDRVSVEELHGVSMVSFDLDLQIRTEIDRALGKRSVETRAVMEFDNIETLKRAVEINAGVSILPAPTVTREVQDGTLRLIEFSDLELVRPVGIIQLRGAELGPTAQRFLRLLTEHSDPEEANESRFVKASVNGNGKHISKTRAVNRVRKAK